MCDNKPTHTENWREKKIDEMKYETQDNSTLYSETQRNTAQREWGEKIIIKKNCEMNKK